MKIKLDKPAVIKMIFRRDILACVIVEASAKPSDSNLTASASSFPSFAPAEKTIPIKMRWSSYWVFRKFGASVEKVINLWNASFNFVG